MSRLLQNATGAELLRGCVFSESFESSDAVVQNGGVIYGVPSVHSGITLNGSTDRVKYNLSGTEFKSTEISFVVEFVPDFAADDGLDHYIFDTTAGYRYLCYKSSGNTLNFWIGNISILSISLTSYQSYWYVGRRNVLVASARSGSIKIYLNGVLIGSDTDVWVPALATDLSIGSRTSPGNYFDGRILKFQIYEAFLSQKEALDFYNRTTYTYMQNATINCPFTTTTYDPTNTKALDVSGKQNHLTLNGATKLSGKKGYEFDGATNYMSCTVPSGTFNTSGISFAIVFIPDFDADDGTDHCFFDISLSGADDYLVSKTSANTLRIDLGNTTVENIAYATFSPSWRTKQVNTLIIAGTSGNTNIWLNGCRILDSDTTAWTPTNPILLWLGIVDDSASWPFDGKILSFQAFNTNLTPLQAMDLHLSLMNGLNNND